MKTENEMNDPRHWTDADFEYAWGLLNWRRALKLRVMRRGLALGMLIGALLTTTSAFAADPQYCQLWAREKLRIMLQSITPEETKIVIEAGQAKLQESFNGVYQSCLVKDNPPALPDDPAGGEQYYVALLWTNLVMWQKARDAGEGAPDQQPVVVPVVETPAADDPDWIARCKARFKTFNEATGMVLMWKDPKRKRKGSVEVRCPE